MTLLNRNLHIVKAAPSAATDFACLLRRGLAYCQALSGASWTDYNEHDPGRTVLEAMCYAITDLGYRCGLPVADVLAEAGHGARPHRDSLFPGPRILTSNALTATDYRKLIIDRALHASWPNFRNVWVDTEADLHAVKIEALDPRADQDCARLRSDVAACFRSHRNCGEGLVGAPEVLELCPVDVRATVELSTGADADATAAALLFALQDALVPFVRVTSVDQALAAGIAPERIFEGPPLQAGIVLENSLRPLRTSLATSELAGAMLAVPGVAALPALQVRVDGAPVHGSARIRRGITRLVPSLFAPLAALPFRFVCQGQPVGVDTGRVQLLLDRLLAAASLGPVLAVAQPGVAPYGPPPPGRRRDIGAYFSPQHQFPAVYGLGPEGPALPRPASVAEVSRQTARLAAARQLKAYLLFFEQWLADAQAQLAHAGRLFSLEPDPEHSYFTQTLAAADGPPALASVLRAGGPAPAFTGDEGGSGSGPGADRYVLHLQAQDGNARPLLRSAEFATCAAAQAAGRRVLARGAHPSHYRVRRLSGGFHQFWLEDEDATPLAFGVGPHTSADQALAAAAAAAALVARLRDAPSDAARALVVVERGERAVRLLDAQGRVVLVGEHLSAAGQARWIAQLWRYGPRRACYRVGRDAEGAWRLALADLDGRVFARGGQAFPDAAEAERQAAAAAAMVERLCCDEAAQARQIQQLPPGDGGGQAGGGDARIGQYERGWASAVRARDPVQHRRNDVLDHLLARFCEGFEDHALARFDPRAEQGSHAFRRELADAKRTFLHLYAVPEQLGEGEPAAQDWLGGARSRGHLFETDTRSGPVARIGLLLGMEGAPQEPQPAPYLYHDPAADRDGSGAAALEAHAGLRFTSDQPALLRALVRHGTDPANYSVELEGDAHALRFRWPSGESATVLRTADAADAEDARDSAVRFLRAYPDTRLRAGERLLAVEHRLLSTGDAQDQPPAFYLYRVSVVLPDWPLRCQDPAFRVFACQVVADNYPAHLATGVYWLNQSAMGAFDTLYRAWQDAPRGATGARAPACIALARFLAGLEHGMEGRA